MSGAGPGGRPSGAPAPSAQAAGPGAHPTNGLDDTVHQRHRLGILTITAEARAEFGYLRDALGLTPGNLSRHLTVLEEAGLVQVEKGYQGRRPRTWVRITGRGRAALAAELATLTELVNRHGGTPGGAARTGLTPAGTVIHARARAAGSAKPALQDRPASFHGIRCGAVSVRLRIRTGLAWHADLALNWVHKVAMSAS